MTSTEEFQSGRGDIPHHVAESIAGQNIVIDLRISELLDIAAKLFERAVGQPSAIAEESAYLVRELQKVVNGQSSWAPSRHDKRFTDPAWTGVSSLTKATAATMPRPITNSGCSPQGRSGG